MGMIIKIVGPILKFQPVSNSAARFGGLQPLGYYLNHLPTSLLRGDFEIWLLLELIFKYGQKNCSNWFLT